MSQIVAVPEQRRLARFRHLSRKGDMRTKLLRAVENIRNREAPTNIPSDSRLEFLYAAWKLAGRDPWLADALRREARRMVLGHSLSRHSQDYAWNGQFWAVAKLVAEGLYGVAHVAFINPGKLGENGRPIRHGHDDFARVMAMRGRDEAEFSVGYDLVLSPTVSWAAAERLERLLREDLGYGALPEVEEVVREVDRSSDLTETSHFEIEERETRVLLAIDGREERVAFWVEEPEAPRKAGLSEEEVVLGKLFERFMASPLAKAPVGFATFLRVLLATIAGALEAERVVLRQVQLARHNARMARNRRRNPYPVEHTPEPKPRAKDLPPMKIPGERVLEATLAAEANVNWPQFPAECFTKAPDLSPRDWRAEVETCRVVDLSLRRVVGKNRHVADFSTFRTELLDRAALSERSFAVAQQLSREVEGMDIHAALLYLKVHHDIPDCEAIRKVMAKGKGGRAQLERLCELSAEIIREREDLERRRQLDADEAEVLASSFDAPNSQALFEEWLVGAYLEGKITREFGHLSVAEAIRDFTSRYHLDVPEGVRRLGEEHGVNMLCAAMAGLSPARDAPVDPEKKPDWVEEYGLADLYQEYRRAAQEERELRALAASRERLFDGSLVARDPDHERLEELAASSKKLPKGKVGELAQARLRHAAACRSLDPVAATPFQERGFSVQKAVASYPREAPRGLAGTLTQLKLEGPA